MGAFWLRIRAELRARWRAWLGLALLVGVAGGVCIALAAGARRTDTAYSRLVEQQRIEDALVFEGGFFRDVTMPDDFVERLEQLPQVASVTRARQRFRGLQGRTYERRPADG